MQKHKESAGPLWATRLRRISFATCTLDILEILQIPNITIWLLCRHVYCNLQAGYTVTLIFGVLQPSGLVACSPPGTAQLPPPDLGLRILGSQPVQYGASAAPMQPYAAPVHPYAVPVQLNATPVQPYAAPVQPKSSQMQSLCSHMQPLCSHMQPLCSHMQPLCSQSAAKCSPCAAKCSPCDAICSPCAAICSPCAAKDSP